MNRLEAWATATRRRTMAIVAACLLLVIYIGFIGLLMVSNYRNQMALRQSTIERFHLDLEKRAASLGYFFSERKYDLQSLSASREISAYFINKSLGMSEQYGLKVSLFVVKQIFEKTIKEKVIGGDKIYDRILLVDREGHPLVDKAFHRKGAQSVSWKKYLSTRESDPSLFVEYDREGQAHILLVAPCYLRGQFAGAVISWLNLKMVFDHLVNFSSLRSQNETNLLATVDGRLIDSPDVSLPPFAANLTSHRISQLPVEGFSPAMFFFNNGGGREMLGTRLPISNTPLSLLAWVPKDRIFETLTPAHLLIGAGSMAVVILLGMGILVWFNTQNQILKARFDESERQQGMVTAKNQELEAEMRRRLEAERQLEEQRILSMRSDRLRSLGEMAAGIAHELNQPLVGVRGLAELILLNMEEEKGSSQGKIIKDAGLIVEQADRMVHIINHVRMFAREAGNPETLPVDLNDVVRSGMSLLAAQFQSHGLIFESEFAQRPLTVRVNPFSIEEVILNLLSNARDAVEKRMQEDGASYTPLIRIRTGYGQKNGENVVWLEIYDNGNGIPQSIADRVFDPFFTTKGPDKGTGLGLSICKSIVEGHGGHIEFTPGQDGGTVFTIEFPSIDV